MNKPGLFASRASFQQAFVDGLEAMLARHPGLGVFILGLANATYDAAIHERLAQVLKQLFQQYEETLRQHLKSGRPVDEAPDDLLVFLKLMAVGFDNLALARFRQAGPYALQFNPLRSFRPPRMSNVTVANLNQPFDSCGFHFNKPFLRKEMLWEGEIQGQFCRLFYNKFPFAPLHTLLVMQPDQEKPQFLEESDHYAVWAITGELGGGMPGVGFGYNAYGAYCSVNHQHLQMFVRDGVYPLESPCWTHMGGNRRYPLACERFNSVVEAWRRLEALHACNTPYNLLYRPGALYVLPRRFQGSYSHATWTSGFAWSEVCGAMTTFNSEDFERLASADLEAELGKLRLD